MDNKTAIIVAIIGLIGVISAALIPKLFTVPTSKITGNEIPSKNCRLPEHGIEKWIKANPESKIFGSGMHKSEHISAEKHCSDTLNAQQKKYPTYKLESTIRPDLHKSERTPFKHDYYNRQCKIFYKKPIYKLKKNIRCK